MATAQDERKILALLESMELQSLSEPRPPADHWINPPDIRISDTMVVTYGDQTGYISQDLRTGEWLTMLQEADGETILASTELFNGEDGLTRSRTKYSDGSSEIVTYSQLGEVIDVSITEPDSLTVMASQECARAVNSLRRANANFRTNATRVFTQTALLAATGSVTAAGFAVAPLTGGLSLIGSAAGAIGAFASYFSYRDAQKDYDESLETRKIARLEMYGECYN